MRLKSMAKKSRHKMLFYTASVAALVVAERQSAIPHKALLRRGEVRELLGLSSACVTQLVEDGVLRVVGRV